MVGHQNVHISLWWAAILPTLRTTVLNNTFCPIAVSVYYWSVNVFLAILDKIKFSEINVIRYYDPNRYEFSPN